MIHEEKTSLLELLVKLLAWVKLLWNFGKWFVPRFILWKFKRKNNNRKPS